MKDDKRSLRRLGQEVNVVVPAVPQYMDWADKPITWSKADHPDKMPTPGGYALVLDPTIKSDKLSIRFSRCLIDGGSSINIMYKNTLDKLGIREEELLPSQTVFHSIVPGHSQSPMGKIWLDVLFEIGRASCRERV